MDASTRRRFSVLLYDALNQQGYSSARIKHRSNHVSRLCQRLSELNFIKGIPSILIPVGSFGEGISKLYSSDMDIMQSYCDIMCVDEVSHENVTSNLVFQNEYTNTSPGYVRLYTNHAVSNAVSSCPYLISQRCIDTGKHYLNSRLTVQELSKYAASNEINGPASTVNRLRCCTIGYEWMLEELNTTKFEGDCVIALPFFSKSILDQWQRRERYHEWPSRSLKREISTMIGYVVPVGHKVSQNKDIEWRISYTTVEKKLVDNMNDVQVKLYVVLKFVQKDRLKPICKNFTSYMVKNLVFWVLELTPIGEYTPELLADRILSAFCHLKQCLEKCFLPCYMIPERNLFDGRMDQMECSLLLREVECIINEGYACLLKNHKLSLSMKLTYSYPEKARDYAQWLVEVEDVNIECTEMATKHAMMSNTHIEDGHILVNMLRDGVCVVQLFRMLQLLGLGHFAALVNMLQDPIEFLRLICTRLVDALS